MSVFVFSVQVFFFFFVAHQTNVPTHFLQRLLHCAEYTEWRREATVTSNISAANTVKTLLIALPKERTGLPRRHCGTRDAGMKQIWGWRTVGGRGGSVCVFAFHFRAPHQIHGEEEEEEERTEERRAAAFESSFNPVHAGFAVFLPERPPHPPTPLSVLPPPFSLLFFLFFFKG